MAVRSEDEHFQLRTQRRHDAHISFPSKFDNFWYTNFSYTYDLPGTFGTILSILLPMLGWRPTGGEY